MLESANDLLCGSSDCVVFKGRGLRGMFWHKGAGEAGAARNGGGRVTR